MSKGLRGYVPAITWGCVALGVVLGTHVARAAPDNSALARELVKMAGRSHGVCAVLGCGDGALLVALARSSDFLIHALDPQPDAVAAARKVVDAAGLYGKRIVVETCDLKRLPHADNSVDVVLATHLTGAKPAGTEAMRVLRPGGVIVILGTLTTCTAKPFPNGIDDWSHWEHGPDNNPVSTDAVIRAPYMTQWLGLPLYITMPAITTAAGGRIFVAMGHIAHHVREESWLNTLVARNAYNGTILWQRKLPDGYLAHRSAFVATDDVFYMIDTDGEGCLMLDPETGREIGSVRLPDHPGEWKWLAIQDGILYVLIGQQKDPAETTIVRSQFGHWSWGELSNGYYQRRVPWGYGKTILAYDLGAKKVVWSHRNPVRVDSRATVLGGGRVWFYAPDAHIGCLDAQSGKVLWTNDDAESRRLIEESGRGLKSTPGFKTTCYCLYTPKALYYQAQTRMNVVAVSLKDGHLLWHRRKTTNNPNMLYVDDHLFVGIGKDGSTLKLDPMTGKTIADLKFAKRSCVRLTATPDSLFCRGMPEGVTRYDRATGKVLFNGAVRPACNDGVIGANGLLYIGPWTCDCNLTLMGRLALCSAGEFKFDRQATAAECLETMKGDVTRVAPFPITAKDWPTYRANVDRSASTPVAVPKTRARLWRQEGRFNGPSAPTAAGGLVFVCDGDGKVRALDAATGKVKWTALTAGPIMQPPTIWNGRAYVGCGDGFVYAFEAATGRALWRFRAAPSERRIMVYDHLCSTWPVNSGVLVAHGVAYAAAGIIDYDGTYVFALDAVTGKPKWQNTSSGHLDPTLRKGVSAQGNLTLYNGKLWMPGGNVVAHGVYELSDGTYRGTNAGNGSPRSNRGEEIGVFRKHSLISGGRLRYSARDNVVNPGSFVATSTKHRHFVMTVCSGKIPPAWDDDRIVMVNGRKTAPQCCTAEQFEACLAKKDRKARPRPSWVTNALNNGDVVSLAMSRNAVLAVCEFPIPRQIKTRWQLVALNRTDGSKLWAQNLSAPALPGGLLIDRDGRVVVVLLDGSVECFGRKRPV